MSFIDTLLTLARDWKLQEEGFLDDYLSEIISLIFLLVQEDEVSSDNAKLIQANLRKIYDSVSTSLNGMLEEHELALVMRAVSSARIYYWVKVLDGQPIDDFIKFCELWEANDDKMYELDEDGIGEYFPNRLSALFQAAVQMGMAKKPEFKEQMIKELKEICFKDFASLQELQRSH